MATHPKKVGLLLIILTLAAAPPALAQETAKDKCFDAKPAFTKAAEAQSQELSQKKEKKITLSDVTRVSTTEAAQDAAKLAAKKKTKDREPGKTSDAAIETEVLEFKPAAQETDTDEASHPMVSTKPVRKNIHGTVSGSLDPKNSANHRTDASVGASSKTGKTSIYVETNQTKSSLASAH